MQRIRLTAAQALVRYLSAQYTTVEGERVPLFAGVFAIFGHGNVAGLGEALYQHQEQLPTYRGHNEQSMALAAIAYAKAHNRQRMMACTSSIGPGASNMVTAAALAHVNRLPVLLLPGDAFASRAPDPVLQQVECFSDSGVTVNDCFKPVSRYFDRIQRPEQLLYSLPIALQTLMDPANCGPVTLSMPQDVQAEAFDYPESFFAEQDWVQRRPPADAHQLQQALELIKTARKPLVIAGGGVLYSQAQDELTDFIQQHQLPVAETQAGKGAISWQNPHYVGAIGVTGSQSANQLAREADLIIAIGTRLQDFITGSRSLFNHVPMLHINVAAFDAYKHNGRALVADAREALLQLQAGLNGWRSDATWLGYAQQAMADWNQYIDQVTSIDNAPKTQTGLPSDAQVVGAVQRQALPSDIIVAAAGSLPSDLHKLWRTEQVNGYHLEYGFSCMGYEIAGGMGVKMAHPQREVIVMLGDGSYLMMNSELATSVMLGLKIIVVLLDNRGFGCINRLQNATGNASFNNLLQDCKAVAAGAPEIDFAMHAKALGAQSEQVDNLEALEHAMIRARQADTSYLISIKTDPFMVTQGSSWWEVAIPAVSDRPDVQKAYADYCQAKIKQGA